MAERTTKPPGRLAGSCGLLLEDGLTPELTTSLVIAGRLSGVAGMVSMYVALVPQMRKHNNDAVTICKAIARDARIGVA